jgi:hypothetical protein
MIIFQVITLLKQNTRDRGYQYSWAATNKAIKPGSHIEHWITIVIPASVSSAN